MSVNREECLSEETDPLTLPLQTKTEVKHECITDLLAVQLPMQIERREEECLLDMRNLLLRTQTEVKQKTHIEKWENECRSTSKPLAVPLQKHVLDPVVITLKTEREAQRSTFQDLPTQETTEIYGRLAASKPLTGDELDHLGLPTQQTRDLVDPLARPTKLTKHLADPLYLPTQIARNHLEDSLTLATYVKRELTDPFVSLPQQTGHYYCHSSQQLQSDELDPLTLPARVKGEREWFPSHPPRVEASRSVRVFTGTGDTRDPLAIQPPQEAVDPLARPSPVKREAFELKLTTSNHIYALAMHPSVKTEVSPREMMPAHAETKVPLPFGRSTPITTPPNSALSATSESITIVKSERFDETVTDNSDLVSLLTSHLSCLHVHGSTHGGGVCCRGLQRRIQKMHGTGANHQLLKIEALTSCVGSSSTNEADPDSPTLHCPDGGDTTRSATTESITIVKSEPFDETAASNSDRVSLLTSHLSTLYVYEPTDGAELVLWGKRKHHDQQCWQRKRSKMEVDDPPSKIVRLTNSRITV